MQRTYVVQLASKKGVGNYLKIEIQATSQSEARKIAENLCKTTYTDRQVAGNPQPK